MACNVSLGMDCGDFKEPATCKDGYVPSMIFDGSQSRKFEYTCLPPGCSPAGLPSPTPTCTPEPKKCSSIGNDCYACDWTLGMGCDGHESATCKDGYVPTKVDDGYPKSSQYTCLPPGCHGTCMPEPKKCSSIGDDCWACDRSLGMNCHGHEPATCKDGYVPSMVSDGSYTCLPPGCSPGGAPTPAPSCTPEPKKCSSSGGDCCACDKSLGMGCDFQEPATCSDGYVPSMVFDGNSKSCAYTCLPPGCAPAGPSTPAPPQRCKQMNAEKARRINAITCGAAR